jgi:hypothetical protein
MGAYEAATGHQNSTQAQQDYQQIQNQIGNATSQIQNAVPVGGP